MDAPSPEDSESLDDPDPLSSAPPEGEGQRDVSSAGRLSAGLLRLVSFPFVGLASIFVRQRISPAVIPARVARGFGYGELASLPVEAQPTAEQRRGMRMFWWDGLFAWFSETIVLQYLALYALAFGASNSQIGLLAALAALSAAAAFFPGARLAETWGRKKLIVVLTGGGAGRLMLLVLAILPFFSKGGDMIYAIIALAAVRGFVSSLGTPAWTALSAEIVPVGMRGRFFSWRNIGVGVGGLVSAPLAGFIIRQFGFAEGWQLAWAIAFLAGIISTSFYARIPEPEPAERAEEGVTNGAPPFATLLADRTLLAFCGTALVWNLSLYVAAPFFNVHLVKNLGASVAWVGGLAAVMSLFGLLGQAIFGKMVDVRGARLVMVLTGLAIPALPLGWFFVQAPWQVIFINALGGVAWAGYNLGAFNLLLNIAPADQRPRYAAAYQTTVFFSAFLGPLMGGFLAEAYGIKLLFLLSAAGRMSATILFLRLVREVSSERAERAPAGAEG
ncbi:MAG: MFS transporter [Dehalococcoidia bacterium]